MSPTEIKRTAPSSSPDLTQSANSVSSLASDASPSSPDVLRTLYAVLLTTRLLEEQVLALLRAGKVPGTSVPLLGGEATEVGACIGLQPDDSFSSSLPTLATHVVRGTPLHHVFAELFRRENGSARPATAVEAATFRVVPQASSLTGQLDISSGMALAYRQLAKSNVVVALAGDGLAALGFWHEAASLASRHRLPIVFMVENCEQSHPSGVGAVQSDEDLRDRAEAYGIPGITVDGNDLVAVWRVTQESIYRARCGAGPTLIECRTWRWHAESSPPSPNGGSQAKQHRQNDPLQHMEHYMKKRSLWKQDWKDELVTQYRMALKRAVAAGQKLPG